jgi:hypothetical protein
MLDPFVKTVDPDRVAPVLYVHPRSQLCMREIIPISLPAIANRVQQRLVGRFEEELTDRQIRAARVVLMDIHWYLTLPAALRLAERVRRVNPGAKIVAGGLTASIFSRQIVRGSPIDFVVRGDAERPLPALVTALLDGGDARDVANLVHREFETPRSYALTRADMDESNYLDLDFFPTLRERLRRIHRQVGRRPLGTHPYSMAFRGCDFDCDCYGARDAQWAAFSRRAVLRSPERVRDDLIALSGDPRWSYVNVFHDIVGTTPRAYWETVYDRRYDLNVMYELHTLPSEAGLSRLLDSFTGGIICFPIDRHHNSSMELAPTEGLIDRIRQAQRDRRYSLRLAYSKVYARKNAVYARALAEVVRATGCLKWDGSCWWADVPRMGGDGDGTEAEFMRYAANRGRRYPWLNVACQTGLYLQRWFPGPVNRAAEALIGAGQVFGETKT